jgi:hypothetical protein
MINDNFLTGAAKLMAGESYTIPSYMAFGSTFGTLTATDLITSGEFDRNILDSKSTTGATVKFVGGRTGVEANNERVQVIGLHNSSTIYSSGNLQANTLIASLTHTTSFDISAEFWITFERI